MKKKVETAYGVIGLGTFWRSAGNDAWHSQGMRSSQLIRMKKGKEMRQYTDCAFVADNLSSDTLKEIGIQNCDVVIICIGEKWTSVY